MGRPRSTICAKGHPKTGDNLLITVENRRGSTYIVHLCKKCTYANHNEWRRSMQGMPKP